MNQSLVNLIHFYYPKYSKIPFKFFGPSVQSAKIFGIFENKSHWVSVFLELGLRQIDVVCQHDEYLKIRFQIGRSANPAASLLKEKKHCKFLILQLRLGTEEKCGLLFMTSRN